MVVFCGDVAVFGVVRVVRRQRVLWWRKIGHRVRQPDSGRLWNACRLVLQEPEGVKGRIVLWRSAEAGMQMKRAAVAATVFGSILGSMLVSGCRVSSDKHGDDDNVKISTPFGGMQVKTNDAAVLENIGLPAYPGSVLVKNNKDKGSADVNFSFGSFHLNVNAASYRTTDGPDQVKAFYQQALEKYGDVLQCQKNRPVGTLTHTSEGLTCDNDKENHISISDDSGQMELKTGSKQHQHLVEITPDGSGTKIGLVALELPGHFSLGEHEKESTQ